MMSQPNRVRQFFYNQFRYLYGHVPKYVYKLSDEKLKAAWEEEAKFANGSYLGTTGKKAIVNDKMI
jgi:hypothetical protein